MRGGGKGQGTYRSSLALRSGRPVDAVFAGRAWPCVTISRTTRQHKGAYLVNPENLWFLLHLAYLGHLHVRQRHSNNGPRVMNIVMEPTAKRKTRQVRITCRTGEAAWTGDV